MSDIVVSDRLSPREKAAYDEYLQRSPHPISPLTQAQFLALFLRGKSCEEIQSLNPGFPLGAIVKCRMEGDWDRRLDEYREQLFIGIKERLTQVELESINFLTDLISVAHKQQGNKLKKFLQNGDEKELGDMTITSIKSYSQVMDLLVKVTGQGKDVPQTVNHYHQIQGKDEQPTLDVSKLSSASSDQAADILAKLMEGKKQ